MAVDQPAIATLEVLSSRADMVTDGSALVSITAPAEADLGEVRVTNGDHDLTSQFVKGNSAGDLIGLVTGLPLGESAIKISGSATGTITVRNHDKNGPIISGPHQSPWICQTSEYPLPDGRTLGPPVDADCNASKNVQYVYRSTGDGAFHPLPDPKVLPPDVSSRTTADGRSVRDIVRVETGTVNRGIYQFSIPYDPNTTPEPQPGGDFPAWNGKAVYVFGGANNAGFVQGKTVGQQGSTLEDEMLSRGYAVLGSSLNVSGNNPSEALSAETASMVKEKFIETFGVPDYTLGWGQSGGAIMQYLLANNYPGILDAIAPGMSFSDLFSLLPTVVDCSLLKRAFESSDLTWSAEQKRAVAGYASWETCDNPAPNAVGWTQAFTPMWMQPQQTNMTPVDFGTNVADFNNCLLDVPRELTYNPVTNPSGARCDMFSANQNMLGIDPATGAGRRGFDNVGVQYGLGAFRDGVIDAEQFIELNRKAGGFDDEGGLQNERTVADPDALDAMYTFGRINQMDGLADIPIIDHRPFTDNSADLHDSVRSLIARERLLRAHGDADNQVILRGSNLTGVVLDSMDEWLTNLQQDQRVYPSLHDKVVASKPAELTDACFLDGGEKIAERPDIKNSGRCGQDMPYSSNPRLVAGEPLTNDVLKCSLSAVDRTAYPPMNDDQFARLQLTFPGGVCDYDKPGVGSHSLVDTWLSYATPGSAEPYN